MGNFDNQNWDETIQIKERVKKIKIGNWAHGNSRVFGSFDVNSEKFGKQHIKDAGIIVDKDSVQQIKEADEKLTAKDIKKCILDGTKRKKGLKGFCFSSSILDIYGSYKTYLRLEKRK